MPSVTNMTNGDIGLTPDVVIAAGASLEIKADTLKAYEASSVVQHYFETNMLTVSDAAKADAKHEVDRDALKQEATALGLEFANNIKTEKLIELIDAAKADA